MNAIDGVVKMRGDVEQESDQINRIHLALEKEIK
jgi:hypothetical protein